MEKYLALNSSLHEDISKRNYSVLTVDGNSKSLGPIRYLNIIVGANNSGKSNFLRGLLKTQSFEFLSDFEKFKKLFNKTCELITTISTVEENEFLIQFDTLNYNTSYGPFSDEIHALLSHNKKFSKQLITPKWFHNISQRLAELFASGQVKDLLFDLKELELIIKIVIKAIIVAKQSGRSQNHFAHFGYNLNNFRNETLYPTFNSLLNPLSELNTTKVEIILPSNKYFVPTLRTAHPLFQVDGHKIDDDIFEKSFFMNYKFTDEFMGALKTKIEILSGLDFYESFLKVRNEFKQERSGHEEFERFISYAFFENKSFEIVSKYSRSHLEKDILIKIDEKEHPIQFLGDGIQSLIILLYPIFTAKPQSWVLIEEPENHLHPGFQRIFLEEVVRNKFIREKELTIFITTHSNHLLDLSLSLNADKSIFMFSEGKTEKNKEVHIIKHIDDSSTEILNALGVKNTSVFISNCSIWVEGISDRLYIKEYLKAYMKNIEADNRYKEDIHFNFFEYGGSNIVHYLFNREADLDDEMKKDINSINAKYLNNKIMVVADSDNNKSKKHTYFLAQRNKNFNYLILPVKEIENLLSKEQLTNSLGNVHSGFRKINWQKVNLTEADYMNYNSKPFLGSVLKRKINNSKQEFPDSFLLNGNKTIKPVYKLKLAKEITKKVNFEKLDPKAQDVIKSIFKFIQESND